MVMQTTDNFSSYPTTHSLDSTRHSICLSFFSYKMKTLLSSPVPCRGQVKETQSLGHRQTVHFRHRARKAVRNKSLLLSQTEAGHRNHTGVCPHPQPSAIPAAAGPAVRPGICLSHRLRGSGTQYCPSPGSQCQAQGRSACKLGFLGFTPQIQLDVRAAGGNALLLFMSLPKDSTGAGEGSVGKGTCCQT